MSDQPSTEVVHLDLTDLAFGGDAVGRLDGEVVFVPFGLPGERVAAQIERRKPHYASARILEVERPSPDRVTPRCPYYGHCGGCQLQHASYPAQLALKRRVLVEQLRRIGGVEEAEALVREPIGMLEPWEYRNHARFSLGRKYGDVGFTRRASHRLLPVEQCPIVHPSINAVLGAIQRRCAGLRAHQITVRCGANTGDLLVSPTLPMVPELDSGQAHLEEEVLDRRFRISAASFFQVNTRREARALPASISASWAPAGPAFYSMADLLALLVLDRLRPQPHQRIVDAYSGVGTFAALIAPHVREVVAIEESPAAVRDAEANVADLPNVRLVTARSEAALPEALEAGADAVVLDPSRLGCARELLDALAAHGPSRVVYVSCDPATLARDLRILTTSGYAIQQVEPVDLFPQTYHIESVTTLTR